ncbi:prephenate dehydrogenase/arogenate dehydrogenase family protein [Candidatus Bathyarchaeota archaeon]|nr:MAG: prephenate dehydrogenase/arogenate dehydrogenase family protein [Candidatus Bathyarchaeota archaeon]
MKVAVIGVGRMGRWFTRYFIQHGHEVSISDVNEEAAKRFAETLRISFSHSNSEAASSSDLVMICTPIKAVPIVVEEILDHVSSSTYIAEISSVKSPVMPSLKKAASSGRLILSLHPLFGPGAEVSAREKMLLTPVSDADSEADFAEKLFPRMEIIPVDFERHDYVMSLTLSLTYYANIALASVLARENIEELRRLGGTTFTIQLMLSESIMTEDPSLCTSIQMSNPYAVQHIERFLSEASKLLNYIRGEDEEKFRDFFVKVHSTLAKSEDITRSYKDMYKALKVIREGRC